MTYEPQGATPATAATNREATGLYAMDDRQDFADADRNLLRRCRARCWATTGTSSSTRSGSPSWATTSTRPTRSTRACGGSPS